MEQPTCDTIYDSIQKSNLTMVATQILTKQGQQSILRIYGNGEVLVEDICQYLNAIDQAYNSVYVFDILARQAREIGEFYAREEFYGRERPPFPLQNLLWGGWWPPNPEKVTALIPDEDRLKLRAVELNSPGFWDFFGKLNPLEVLREYLKDRHERRKDREYRELEEAKKLQLENELKEIQVLQEKYDLLKAMGATNEDIALLKSQLLYRPLKKLNAYQDQKLITTADIIDY